jgi:hypothetical protein
LLTSPCATATVLGIASCACCRGFGLGSVHCLHRSLRVLSPHLSQITKRLTRRCSERLRAVTSAACAS